MKKFFKKIFYLSIPFAVMLIVVFAMPPNKRVTKSLLFAQIDKKALIVNTPSPRIILIGGSSLSLGLNSQEIKDSLHLNPVNMGVHAALGLKYMLSTIEEDIKQGDIVVVAPEYQQFYGNLANGELELLSTIADVDPKQIAHIDFKQAAALIPFIPKYFRSKVGGYIDDHRNKKNTDTAVSIFERKSFNAFGDTYAQWNLPRKKVEPFAPLQGEIKQEVIEALKRFKDKMENKKARLFISFPGYQDLSFQNSTAKIDAVADHLEKGGLKLISVPQEYIMADSLTFDTPYHLTKAGVDRRTRLLIKDLKTVLN